MHKIKVRNLKRNEVGKFDPEISDWRNPYKAVIKFEDTKKLPELAHYDGIDDGWIMTNEEYEALTSGKFIAVSAKFMEYISLLGTVVEDMKAEANKEQE